MTHDREWRELAWEEGEMERQMKASFVEGSADFFIGFRAEQIPIMIEAFESIGNSHMVDVLKKMQDDGVGRDRQMVEKEGEE